MAVTVIGLNSCAPPQTPPSAVTYQISVAASRKVALVTPSAPLASIKDLEDAVSRDTGCRATAIARAYDATDQDRNLAVPSSLYTGFGGRLPVTLDCT